MKHESVILDCYTDEPSGYGVRPYLGTHQLHLSQALTARGEAHAYLTIDDLRSCAGRGDPGSDETDISVLNTTVNRDNALEILEAATTIYVIMGCFVDYQYFSCLPPRSAEVYEYFRRANGRKILFYVMGIPDGISPEYSGSHLSEIVDRVEHGNTYRFAYDRTGSTGAYDLINPDYELLARISSVQPMLVDQLTQPVIAEIETGTGCNTPTCSFCIESVRSPKVVYREPEDIVAQVGCLYDAGVRHFRLGRQPNFFHYQRQNIAKLERLLVGIRVRCPELRMLHIDNVNIINVVSRNGARIADLVAQYCTSGNVAPFGIESFDPAVREATGVAGAVADVLRAIEVINKFGAARGENGIPRFLPGVNLIHGLPGATERTHELNQRALAEILARGLMTYRFYYRNMTNPTGVSLRQTSVRANAEEFVGCFGEIIRDFVLPMQSRVYPEGSVISGDWEVVRCRGATVARTLGTCSVKVEIGESLPAGQRRMAVRVRGNHSYRMLSGSVM